ncbi:RDD family protein [Parvibium lacunae]|uniref:RDD family protein n=1 Tax=Parvibium lacunae TaxID=1888893 RepID=A0A368L6P0_9BURK|nr:RDD family protein [Parvibium lacunae]RCS59340.1 RDD family protein [Parvibium lacunae]
MPDKIVTDQPSQPEPVTVIRRLKCMVYEGLLLFGLYFAAAFLFLAITNDRDIAHSHRQPFFSLYIFLVFGVYFVYCWTRSGQTLAMKTWQLKLCNQRGGMLSLKHAVLRYVFSYAWFLPSCLIGLVLGREAAVSILISVVPSIILWSLTAKLDPARQFLHDRLARTQVILSDPRSD